MSYSASLSSCTSRALRASVHTVHVPLSVAVRALRHAARCSAILGCRICAETDGGLTPSAAARCAWLMSYSTSLSSCTSRAFVHTVAAQVANPVALTPASCTATAGLVASRDHTAAAAAAAADHAQRTARGERRALAVRACAARRQLHPPTRAPTMMMRAGGGDGSRAAPRRRAARAHGGHYVGVGGREAARAV
eukprot:scaffold3430_cov258-Prasinococcus_capsulatus_cf.AAC.1